MAKIIGGIGTTHVPAIGGAIAKGLQNDPYWKPFFDGFAGARRWLGQVRPDVVVVLYNDHGLNFFLDKMPTFAVGAASEYKHADEGWGLPVSQPYPGDPSFSWHLIESLVADEFDVTTCQEMLVDHAFTIPLSLLWPEPNKRPVRTIPVSVNTVQHPLPSPARCLKLGQAIGRAIASYDADLNVLVLGTGGLSHQLDGKRAGFINKEFDLMCMDKLVGDPEALARYSSMQIVEQAGSQGVELLNWIRDARRVDRQCLRNSPQLSRPDLQHRIGAARARKSALCAGNSVSQGKLVSRFRSSQALAARPYANFGIKGTLATLWF